MSVPTAPAPAPISATPVRLAATPGEIRRRAPRLGEHTDEVLRELGYAVADIERLRARGVV